MRISTVLLSCLLRGKMAMNEKEVRSVHVSQSVSGEDLLIAHLLEGRKGTYLEIGSNHPRSNNLTYLLYCQGWSGLCIDPNPRFLLEYKNKRPKDIFLNKALSETSGDFLYHEYQYDQLNHITLPDEEPRPQGEGILLQSRPIQSIGWGEALKHLEGLGSPLRLVLIDAEHVSVQVLLSAPFGPEFLPDLLVVEVASASDANKLEKKLGLMGYATVLDFRKYPSNIFLWKVGN